MKLKAQLALLISFFLIALNILGFLADPSTALAENHCKITATKPPSGTDHTGYNTQVILTPIIGRSADSFFISEKQSPRSSEYKGVTQTADGWVADLGKIPSGTHTVYVFDSLRSLEQGRHCGSYSFSLIRTDQETPSRSTDTGKESAKVTNTASGCTGSECPTGVGVISTNSKELVSDILKFALGIAGGIAFLMIVYSGFRLAFSKGDPEAVQGAKDMITSAVVGLLIIVFSTFILRLVGIDILGLPL